MEPLFFILAHSLLATSLVGIMAILASKIPLVVNFSEGALVGKLEKIFSFSPKTKKKKRKLKQDYWDSLSK